MIEAHNSYKCYRLHHNAIFDIFWPETSGTIHCSVLPGLYVTQQENTFGFRRSKQKQFEPWSLDRWHYILNAIQTHYHHPLCSYEESKNQARVNTNSHPR